GAAGGGPSVLRISRAVCSVVCGGPSVCRTSASQSGGPDGCRAASSDLATSASQSGPAPLACGAAAGGATAAATSTAWPGSPPSGQIVSVGWSWPEAISCASWAVETGPWVWPACEQSQRSVMQPLLYFVSSF